MRTNFTRKIFGLIAAIVLVSCIGITAALSVKILDGNVGNPIVEINSDDERVAYAATTPEMTSSLIRAQYGEIGEGEYGIVRDNSPDSKTVIFDITTDAWKSTDWNYADKSIFSYFALSLSLSGYTYDKITELYTDEGKTKYKAPETEEIETEGGATDFYFVDQASSASQLEITSILVDGTTWYGDSVSDKNLLDADVVAGSYTLKSVSYEVTGTVGVNYFKSKTTAFWKVSLEYKGDAQETKTETGTINLTSGGTADVSDFGLTFFLRTSVAVDNVPTDNFNIEAIYDGATEWAGQIKLYGTATSATAPSFVYSTNFTSKLGLIPDETGSNFGMGEVLFGSNPIGDYFQIYWYTDVELSGALESGLTMGAGTYYLHIENKMDADKKKENYPGFYYIDGGVATQAVNFVYGGSEYVPQFKVARKTLKVSIKDEMGLKLNDSNGNGRGSTSYNGSYAETEIFSSEIGTSITQTGKYYVYAAGTYSDACKTTIDATNYYYVNYCALGDAIKNTIIYSADSDAYKTAWRELGGCESDLKYIKDGSEVISLKGYFTDKVPKTYTSATMFLSLGVNELVDNYEIDLGEYNGTVWTSYRYNAESQDEKVGKLLKSGTSRNGYSLSQYYYYGDFEVTAPILTVDLTTFETKIQSCYYGEIASCSEIDFSDVRMIGGSLTEVSDAALTWDIANGLDKWRIKVVSSQGDMNVNDGYNYIYVYLRFAKQKSDLAEPLYEDLDGNTYVGYDQMPYAGDYYIVCSIHYRLAGENTQINPGAMKKGSITVSNDKANVAQIALINPASFTVNKVKLYLNLTDYSAEKYYDGTDSVLNGDGTASAVTVLKQAENTGVFSPSLNKSTGKTSILEYDMDKYFSHESKIVFSSSMSSAVDSGIYIKCDGMSLRFKDDIAISADAANSISNSYDYSDIELRIDDVKQTIPGTIKRRTLDLRVLKDPDRVTDETDPEYSTSEYHRGYGANIYVAVRVARYSDKPFGTKTVMEYYEEMSQKAIENGKGGYKSITTGKEYYADLYYVNSSKTSGYYFYSELPDIFGQTRYLFVEIDDTSDIENHGFLNTDKRKEGFNWSDSILRTYFDSDYEYKEIYYPFNKRDLGAESSLNPQDYIDWENAHAYNGTTGTIDTTPVGIDEDTFAGYYILNVALGCAMLNYDIVLLDDDETDEYIGGSAITFEITQIVQNPDEVFETNDLKYYYDKTAKINQLCTSEEGSSYIRFSKHRDYDTIKKNYARAGETVINFKDMITVIGYEIDWNDAKEEDRRVFNESEFTDDIKTMLRAGKYTVRVTVPETQNYKAVEKTYTIIVNRAAVQVYTTVALRTYTDSIGDELKYDGTYAYLSSSELEQFAKYIDQNEFEFVEKGTSGAIKVYIRYSGNDDTIIDLSGISIYYVGFIGGDKFGDNANDQTASLIVNPSTTTAGLKKNAVILGEAYSRDYSFSYFPSDMYIKRQALMLDVDGNQRADYNGANLSPQSQVTTVDGSEAPSAVKQTIIGYFSKQTDGYRIWVKSKGNLEEAIMATSPDELNDYYYYFEEFYDENGNPIDVKRLGSKMSFVKDGQEMTVYNSGRTYYYYADNNKAKAKITITKNEIAVYADENGCYYYKDNNASTSRVNLSKTIQPNFELTSMEDIGGVQTEVTVSYVAEIDGKKLYLTMAETSEAASKESVQDVFYDGDGNIGGYILRVYAVPGEGASSTNYKDSRNYTVFLSVDILTIDLIEKTANGTTGTTITPLWDTAYYGSYVNGEYVGTEYALRDFGDYYMGKTRGGTISLGKRWATISIENFAYNPIYAEDLTKEEKVDMFIAYDQTAGGGFSLAAEDAKINNAGLYAILIKVTINENVVTASSGEDGVNMRRNLKFVSQAAQANFNGAKCVAENSYETYFVLYLNMERATDIALKEVIGNGVTRDDKANGEGYKGTFTKEYDAKKIAFGSTLKVTGQESGDGRILEVKAYITDDLVNGERYEYLKNGTAQTWGEKEDLSLTHVNDFYIEYIVNERNDNYNNNFATIKSVYYVKINPKTLTILISVKDENGDLTNDPEQLKKYSNKNYGQKNSDVTYKYGFIYSGWAGSDKTKLEKYIEEPKLDWARGGLSVSSDDEEGQNLNAGTDYALYANGGSIPEVSTETGSKYCDYVFNYDIGIPFEIKKLKMQIGETQPGIIIESEKTYEGKALVPEIKRYGFDGKLLDSGEDSVYEKSVVYKGYIENYDPDVSYGENSDGVSQKIKNAVSVGYYLFSISIGNSKNYEGIDTVYWVFRITKKDLYLRFVDDSNQVVSKGTVRKTYDKTQGNYPAFNVKYDGFMGVDDTAANAEIQSVKFRASDIGKAYYSGISILGLVNPLYVFIDKDKGEELISGDGTPFMPVDVGTYYVKIVLEDGAYGYASNYNIVVDYDTDDNGKTLYPELIIGKRKVSVLYTDGVNDKITKVYDGTTDVKENSVTVQNGKSGTNGNYSFSGQAADIGLIAGDYISLKINYGSSKYARKSVKDEYDEESDIEVYLHVDEVLQGDSAANYELDFENSPVYTEREVRYIKLCGKITPATATVKFFDKDGNGSSNLSVEYNGEAQNVDIKVYGVNNEILVPTFTDAAGKETGDYSVTYKSESRGYDSSEAPTNSGKYDVTVTIKNSNYQGNLSATLEVLQAQVEITFGGDSKQTYGSVIGLSAQATGVGGYKQTLAVNYYTIGENGEAYELISDIASAEAGEYIAVAIHNSAETDNFAYKRATESFTVLRRDTAIKYDVSSRYKYTGVAVSIKMYFEDRGETRYPQLIFDRYNNGRWEPANYGYGERGEITDIRENPSRAGQYRVKAYEYLDNFFIADPVWVYFMIEKASLTLETKDLSVNEGDIYDMEAAMKNSLTDDPLSDVVEGLKFTYYDGVTGAPLTEKPTQPGTYKVVGYGASSENYTISYTFGLLTIYKTKIKAESGANAKDVEVDIEGSFTSGTQISVDKKQNTDYSAMNEAFSSFKQTSDQYRKSGLNDIFVFSYGDYGKSEKNDTTFKIYAPNMFGANTAETETISVAVLAEDGSIKVVEAQKDGDYLKFSTSEKIQAVSVISETNDVTTNAYDWILYVGIALSVLVLGLAILIVIKKA